MGKKFDFKTEYRDLYMPKRKPQIISVPKMNYIAIRGKGDPNEEGGAYKQAVGILYSVAYTLKMSYMTEYKIEGFFEYVVPPLEGFWKDFSFEDKSLSSWISVIRLPDFITGEHLEWAVKTASSKNNSDCSAVEFLTVDEGMCVQIMHIGSYDDEPASIALMDDFLKENSFEPDLTPERLHHEIYLSDPRRTAPERLKTVLRQPIKEIPTLK